MLSALAQGYGAWDGSASSKMLEDGNGSPILSGTSGHKHGVTVKSARRSKHRIITVEEISGCIHIPKTYLTRKGALVLYSSEKESLVKEADSKLNKPGNIAKVLERLGNVRRLMASILFLNDTQAPDPDVSVSDEKNQVFMGFLRTLDSVLYKQKMQPGCDLGFYLKALRIHARKLSDMAGAEIVDQIEALLATPSMSSRPSTTAAKSSRMLSSAKLTASIKSDTYMGRKILYPVLDTTLHDFSDTNTPYSVSAWPNQQLIRESLRNPPRRSLDAEDLKEEVDKPVNKLNSVSSSRRSSKSASYVSDRASDTNSVRLRINSVGSATNCPTLFTGHRRSESRASAATSGSLVEDPSLYEEVDIPLPKEAVGAEPDSDLEKEHFKSVLNVDDLPTPDLQEVSGANRINRSKSDTGRHLTNTPDVARSFIGVQITHSAPITPEITLRAGANNSTFNILDSHVEPADTSIDLLAEAAPKTEQIRQSYSELSSLNITPRRDSNKSTTSATDLKSSNRSEYDLSLSNDEEFEISVVLGNRPKAEGETHDEDVAGDLRRPSSQSNAHRLEKKKTTSDMVDTNSSDEDPNQSLPEIVKREHTTPASKERLTPSPLSIRLSGESRVSVDLVRPHTGRKGSAHSSTRASQDTIPKRPKKGSLTDALTSNEAEGVQLPEIHDKATKEKDKLPPPASSTRAKSATTIHPSTSTVLKTGPQLSITQLETEPVPARPKSELVYHIPETPRQQSKVREADKEALQRAERMELEDQIALEALMKDPLEVKEVLESNLAEEFEEGGLTAEEMELAQEILQQRLVEAERGIAKKLGIKIVTEAKKEDKKLKRKVSKPLEQVTQSPMDDSKAKRKELIEKRDKIRQAKILEQQKRVSEKKALQERILTKAKEKQSLLEHEQRKIKEVQEKERYTSAVAEGARQQEEMARRALAESRRQAKEEREKRRKEELERRKEEAIRRYLQRTDHGVRWREEQTRMQDAARQKELDMLEKISGAETVHRLREQENKRKEEEEWKLQARLMAEEQAMARLVEERMEAELQERELQLKRRQMQELEDGRRAQVEAEQKNIEEELRLTLEEEEREREAECRRILELKRLEAEAQERMRQEIEERRKRLMELRELNMEKKKHLETIKKNQAYTKPWVFSYYVKWPRESYEMLIGGLDRRRKEIPKKKTESK